jgi:hypothetical protein
VIAERRRASRCSCALVLLAWALPLLVLTVSTRARADAGEADTLFREGRELLRQERFEEACNKLEESNKLDPSSGTLLNLAHCHEQLGRYATAFAEFSRAAEMAEQQQVPARVAEARRRVELLRPRLSYLVVQVSGPIAGLEVERNGERLEPRSYDQPVAVDPGTQTIRASAPGYTEWSVSLWLTQPGEQVVVVPPLAPERKPVVEVEADAERAARQVSDRNPPARPAPRLPAAAPARGLSPSFWIAAGTTVVATGVATAAGIMSLSSYHDAERQCPTHTGCSQDALDARSRAGTLATVTNVAVAAAVLGAGTSVYLFITSRSASQRRQASVSLATSTSSGAAAPTWSW